MFIKVQMLSSAKRMILWLEFLPIFHAFGLTISLVSLFQGGYIACHPDPTDAKGVANLIKKIRPQYCVQHQCF